MARKKVYWIGLLAVARRACRYWLRWRGYLPDDLDPRIKAAFDAMVIACELLIAYDKTHARGKGN